MQPFKITGRSINNWWGTDATLGPLGTAAFSQPVAGTYGNSRVGTLTGPGYRQFDLSLFKDFTVYREQKINFRANMYNFSNTSSWSNPGNTEGSTSFGLIGSVRNNPRQVAFSARYSF